MNLRDYVSQYRITRNIKRFGMETVIHPQDLAGHGYGVANLFYLFCKAKKIPVSAKSMFLVMNHDFAETFTGDLNKRVKDQTEETSTAWGIIERKSVPGHLSQFTDEGLKEELSRDEYEMFTLADCMDAYLYCFEEYESGNRHLMRAMNHYGQKLTNYYMVSIGDMDNESDWVDTLQEIKEVLENGRS